MTGENVANPSTGRVKKPPNTLILSDQFIVAVHRWFGGLDDNFDPFGFDIVDSVIRHTELALHAPTQNDVFDIVGE